MFNKYYLIFHLFILFVFTSYIYAQDCTLNISGYVEDADMNAPMEHVHVHLNDGQQGDVTDSLGFFSLIDLCIGDYYLTFTYVGWLSKTHHIYLKHDTVLNITMVPSNYILDDIVVEEKVIPNSTQELRSINKENIIDNASKDLSSILEVISGVSVLKTGSGISKPIVHGLYGNRLTILNNGILHSAQQWGNDHSPEIDPMVAHTIKVIKGASSLKYGGANLGAVILVEPKRIENIRHLHGSVNYFFESNGLGNGLNLQMHEHNPILAWHINGTFKKSGDKKTAHYYLNNTGHQEANFAIQLSKIFADKFLTDVYYSMFNTTIGILRGAHISNTTDLKQAFARHEPFYTEGDFSYGINPPKQNVYHQLLKLHFKYLINSVEWLDFTIARQSNRRKEFDIRRGDRTDTPELDLHKISYFMESTYHRDYNNDMTLDIGIQSNIKDNTNNPETGIHPLIPDYLSYENGMFLVFTKGIKKSFFEVGLRYDNIIQNVATITSTIPKEVKHYSNIFHNISGAFGWLFQFNEQSSLSYNIGYVTRNPAINELYSFGLHQGVSSIEEGNIALHTEKSLKSTLAFKTKIKNVLSFESLAYYHNINDYIFLNAQNELRLTIRGAFPVFKYEQTHAQIYGLDILSQFHVSPSFNIQFTYSYIKGEDLDDDVSLVNIPSNSIVGMISYKLPKLSMGELQLEGLEFKIENKYVFRKEGILPEQDFVLAPDAYNLLNFKVVTDIQVGKTKWRLYCKLDNLLNVSYRDYLNRQRYFADDLGINTIVGINMTF